MGDQADLLAQYAEICGVPITEVNQQDFVNWLSGTEEENEIEEK